MESKNSVILESCGEDSIFIQTMKNMVNENASTESEEEGFFVVTGVRNEQRNEIIISNEESTIAQSEEQFSMSNLCRVCANSNDHLIPIFEGEGLQHDLCNKIHKYLPIHVGESDSLPLQLCYHCAATLLAWHELLEGCLNAERRLLEIQTTLQEKQDSQGLENSIQDTTSASNITESPHSQQDTVKEEVCVESAANESNRFGLPQKKSCMSYCSWQQVICRTNPKEIAKENATDKDDADNLFDNYYDVGFNIPEKMEDMSLPLNETTNSLKNQHKCKDCQRTFKREFHLIRHISTCKSKLNSNIQTKNVIVNGESISDTNEIDNTNTENRDRKTWKLSRNCKKKRSKTYLCIYCDYVGSQEGLLKIHLKESHPEYTRNKDKKLKCVDRETVKCAKMEINGKVYYHCNECGKNLYSPYTFLWHTRIHTGERPYTCHLCGKQFRVNQGLARHLRETHAGIKNFPCDICGRMFATKRSVEDHIRIHTGERPYICNVCGKSFKQKASLFVHNRTHLDVFPFKCNYCDQNFRTRPSLMVHITKHTGEKPHACDVCGRCFRIKYELKRHRLIHFDEKPWKCMECNLSYRQKRYLVNHRKINHNTSLLLSVVK